jgi:hypothetical protein
MRDGQRTGTRMAKKVLWTGAAFILFSLIIVPWKMHPSFEFAWHQQLPEPNDVAGWRLYQSMVSGGPYALIETIPFKEAQSEYTSSKAIDLPSGQEQTLYFVMTAFNTSHRESRYSDEVSARVLAQKRGILNYGFVWAGNPPLAMNYQRIVVQLIVLVLGTGLAYILALRRGKDRVEGLLGVIAEEKQFYCETCKKPLADPGSVEVHRAFGHEVKKMVEEQP